MLSEQAGLDLSFFLILLWFSSELSLDLKYKLEPSLGIISETLLVNNVYLSYSSIPVFWEESSYISN